MNNKRCTGCARDLPITEFHWRSKKKGTRISRCMECSSKWSKAHYEKNKDMYVTKARSWNKKNMEKTFHYIMEYLSQHPCVDCNESDPIVLQFDHVRGTKKGDVSSMFTGSRSMKEVKEEIDKCEVRCANCHCRRTAKQFGYRKYILLHGAPKGD